MATNNCFGKVNVARSYTFTSLCPKRRSARVAFEKVAGLRNEYICDSELPIFYSFDLGITRAILAAGLQVGDT